MPAPVEAVNEGAAQDAAREPAVVPQGAKPVALARAEAKPAAPKPAAPEVVTPQAKAVPKPAAPAKPAAPKPAAAQTPKPTPKAAGMARRRLRHHVVALSFLAWVVLPMLLTLGYLFLRAEDQYASNVGFAVRTEDNSAVSSLLGGIIGVSGASSSDTDILYRFIQSRDMMERADRDLDLKSIFSPAYRGDPLFALDPDASREDMLAYWNRMVKVFYDNRTGLIEVRANAFDQQDAERITRVILAESTATINELSAIAREDSTRYAREELDLAQDRLREARLAVADFRRRNQVVDPTADVAGQMSLLRELQSQLATAIIEADMLGQNGVKLDDPRLVQLNRRKAVIEDRIRGERAKIGTEGTGEQNYSDTVGEYERLRVDQEFAEKAYLANMAAYDAARADAQKKSRYLATYLPPTLADTAEYPRRGVIGGMVLLFLILSWSVFVMVYYAIRDRR